MNAWIEISCLLLVVYLSLAAFFMNAWIEIVSATTNHVFTLVALIISANVLHAGTGKSGIGGTDGQHGLEEYLQSHVVYPEYENDFQ